MAYMSYKNVLECFSLSHLAVVSSKDPYKAEITNGSCDTLTRPTKLLGSIFYCYVLCLKNFGKHRRTWSRLHRVLSTYAKYNNSLAAYCRSISPFLLPSLSTTDGSYRTSACLVILTHFISVFQIFRCQSDACIACLHSNWTDSLDLFLLINMT